MTFSKIILTLQEYWSKQGCLISKPYDVPAGAGTYHQATFLRSLGKALELQLYMAHTRRPLMADTEIA